MDNIIPKPVATSTAPGAFSLSADAAICVNPPEADLLALGDHLRGLLAPVTGYALPVLPGIARLGGINLSLTGDHGLGEEGYELTVRPDAVTLEAYRPAGIFWGLQTLRQLLPARVERRTPQPGPWEIPAGTIRDYPRFAYRGAMLDVARHFFGVEDVKRFIDLAAAYKINHVHLHLTDDQGWRIEIQSWPKLAAVGGLTEVGGGAGGFYTQAEYAEIVAYAAGRYITIVPEIDLPGHTNAASAAYPELNGNGKTPALYTGTEVGFSTLAIRDELTYRFLDDVIRELAALTPGPYIHIGGDECHSTAKDDYLYFIGRVQDIARAHGKRMIGWEEIGQCTLGPDAIAQYWAFGHAANAAKQGAKVIFSPATKTYLDMKYDESTPLGLNWAGLTSVEASYQWDPATMLDGVGESDIFGVEAPLWTETIETMDDIEYLVFPRLLGVAEAGWSPEQGRNWEEYRLRLAAHGPRLEALGVNFFRSADVPWQRMVVR